MCLPRSFIAYYLEYRWCLWECLASNHWKTIEYFPGSPKYDAKLWAYIRRSMKPWLFQRIKFYLLELIGILMDWVRGLMIMDQARKNDVEELQTDQKNPDYQLGWAILAECRQLDTHKRNFHFMYWKFSQLYLLDNINVKV